MYRPKIAILGSLQLLSHSKRCMTGMTNNFIVKKKLPDLPAMETITARDRDLEALVQTHLSSQKVKHGDYNFIECKEGYILCYINAFVTKKQPPKAFYGVFYGDDHPLNTHGPVKSPIQTLSHGRCIAILHAIQNFPKFESKKLCICTDCTRTLKLIDRLPNYIESGYRRMSDGRVLEVKYTLVQLTNLLRLRNDLQLRFMYAPSDVIFHMKSPLKLAATASRLEIEDQYL